jgi:hypothetical protein
MSKHKEDDWKLSGLLTGIATACLFAAAAYAIWFN